MSGNAKLSEIEDHGKTTRGTLGKRLRFLVVMSNIFAVFPLRCQVTFWLVKPT